MYTVIKGRRLSGAWPATSARSTYLAFPAAAAFPLGNWNLLLRSSDFLCISEALCLCLFHKTKPAKAAVSANTGSRPVCWDDS